MFRHRVACVVILSVVAWAEQSHVTRYDMFVGSSFFSSPKIDLVESGIHLQIGVRPAKWYSLGFDFSNVNGDLTLTPDLLPQATQDHLRAQLAGLAAAGQVPAGYQLKVVSRSKTQTFTAGPQLAYRRWTRATLFIRPSCGLIREVAHPEPKDPISRAIVAQLAPEGEKRDWAMFYGGGGGVDLNFNPHFSLRVQADFVYDHLFPETLREGRPTVRFSVGPAFNFGKNIIRR